MEVIVRQAEPGDEAAIARVQVAAWQAAYAPFFGDEFLRSLSIEHKQETWRDALTHPGRGRYRVAEADHRVQGFAVFGPARDDDLDETASELVALNIHPDCWRLKLGTALLDAVLQRVAAERYKTLHLWVIEGNAPAIKLYEKSGFTYSGMSKAQRKHSGRPVIELRYAKALG